MNPANYGILNSTHSIKADAGISSYQLELVCQRAIFMSVQLESMEVAAAEGREFNDARYTQMLNSFMGLLKHLGLKKLDGDEGETLADLIGGKAR